MLQFKGKGVYPAIAVGPASLFKRQQLQVCRRQVKDTQAEIERVKAAKQKAMEQLCGLYEKTLKEAGEESAQIFEIHKMMLEDEDYSGSIQNIINTQAVNGEYAVAVTADNFSDMFGAMDDEYMQSRAADVRDISNRLIACMTDTGCTNSSFTEKAVIIADDLAPSETALLDKDKVLAFVTASGSSNSHTAILAGSMNIPAVVGVGKDILQNVRDGQTVIVDGITGQIIIDPDQETMAQAEADAQQCLNSKLLLKKLKGKPNVTLDGTSVDVYANISGTQGTRDALENDADGIGLFRSEFLYLESEDYPSEEEQFKAYKSVLEKMAGKRVIIRTLDIGADKQIDYFKLEKEDNPALGLRAIRLCLTRPQIFETQLRALYRASVYGKLGIMFPMITSVKELERIERLCSKVKKDLADEGIPFAQTVETGIMIETPAAAMISDRLAAMVDFFSVGTNDLTQYTLACDRQNAAVEQFVDTHHEAVLRLIELSAKNAHAGGAWIGICGELAADLSLTEYFLRIGIDELSVSPPFILPLRSKIRSIDLSK